MTNSATTTFPEHADPGRLVRYATADEEEVDLGQATPDDLYLSICAANRGTGAGVFRHAEHGSCYVADESHDARDWADARYAAEFGD